MNIPELAAHRTQNAVPNQDSSLPMQYPCPCRVTIKPFPSFLRILPTCTSITPVLCFEEPVLTVFRGIHDITLFTEFLGKKIQCQRIVVNDENFHRRGSWNEPHCYTIPQHGASPEIIQPQDRKTARRSGSSFLILLLILIFGSRISDTSKSKSPSVRTAYFALYDFVNSLRSLRLNPSLSIGLQASPIPRGFQWKRARPLSADEECPCDSSKKSQRDDRQ